MKNKAENEMLKIDFAYNIFIDALCLHKVSFIFFRNDIFILIGTKWTLG